MSAVAALAKIHLPPAFPRARIHGDGLMSRLMRYYDWRGSVLGEPESWPESLLTVVNLVLASPIPTSLYWGPHHVLVYNDGYRQFMGSRHPASLGKPGAEVWKEAWHIVGPQIEQTYATSDVFHGENFLVPIEENGQMVEHYWNYTLSSVYDPVTGRIAGVYNTCSNATESFLTARERNQLNDRLHQVMESTSDGVVSIDRSWRFTYMNENARRTAYPLEDLIGRNIWEALPGLVYEGSPNVYHYHRAMDENEPGEFESYYPAPLNHWLHVQVRPSADGIVLFFRDITEQKLAAAALATSEEELRWTIRMSTQNPWTADVNGKLLTGGDILLEHPGRPSEILLDKLWTECIHPEDRPKLDAVWRYSLLTGEPFDMEHRLRTASGEFHWLRARAYPRRDTDGKVIKWYGTTEDIHARKQAEQALRTAEKLAAVGRLATSIAHEINNPLEAVTNLLYLARTSEELDEVLKYVRSAEQELHRASVITNQTLRFQRQSSAPIALSLEDLIENCLGVFQGKLKNSSVVPEKRLRARRPITCYDGEIRQVFLNLVGNAIDAMQPAGGRLLIRTREATHPATGQRGILLTVADTGSGISPEAQQRIFEPFFTTKGLAGTGLGLWVSLGIVARHQGSLRVRSRQRKRRMDFNEHGKTAGGTVFNLFLPFDVAARLAVSPVEPDELDSVAG